ncbi:DUF1589 domain-containing protein [Rhodopirellula baltica]|uniref:DUF1589 domain-containing protein n=1 Tax=Rhodopirellula baltica TaxID=265606 RepID=UPI0036F35FC9
MTWHPADALEQSEASSNLANKLQTCRPFTSPCRTWPTYAATRTRKLKKSN